jgi:predicted AlkP superfamily phosphohydrolase/phosphomutase
MQDLKVFVLGLGGINTEILKTMIVAGKLPGFARLMSEGLSGELGSVIPLALPTTWTSLTTGLNPGKHGIYDFFHRLPGSYDMAPVNTHLRSGKPLWTILSEQGKRVGVFNVPVTYPPEKVNGFLVAGMDTPNPAHPVTYPQRLADDLRQAVGDYIIDVYETLVYEEESLQKLLYMLDRRFKALDYLVNRYTDLDFLFVGFTAFDHFHRLFWKYIDPNGQGQLSVHSKTLRNALEKCYRYCDDFISQLLVREERDGNVAIVVVSDRGFGPLRKVVYINNWLSELGLLRLKEGASEESGFLRSVDWTQTMAYSFGSSGSINLNLRGREPQGIVEQGREAEELKGRLEQELVRLRASGRETVAVSRVYRKEELYMGPRFAEAPDLLVMMADDSYLARGGYNFGREDIFVAPAQAWRTAGVLPPSGCPRSDGFLLARGPGFSPGAKIEGASIIDFAPTILYIMGLSVPVDIDGKLLEPGIEEEYLQTIPFRVTFQKSDPADNRVQAWGEGSLAQRLMKKDAYIAQLNNRIMQLEREVKNCREIVDGFEKGRFMRMMRTIHKIKKQLFGPRE